MNAATMNSNHSEPENPNNDQVESDLKAGSAEHLLSVVQRLENDLDTLHQDLIGSQRLATLGTVSSIIAHETANLLTPVSSYAQLALSQPDNAELTRKALLAAVEGVGRVSKITTSMLGLVSEDSSGHLASADEETCDVTSAFAKALDCLGRDPKSDGIELIVELEVCEVSISEVELQQVFLNLLINARKAMLATRRGVNRLKIAGKRSGGAYGVEVSDTGPGIPAGIASTLFEPFVTSTYSDDQREKSRGSGLGLSICREILSRAGGEISVASTSDRGTTFSLTLPVSG